MDTRASLRLIGQEVLDQLQHGTNPPRTRPLYQSDIPGLANYTHEALWASVWARPGLPMRDRMLTTVAVLVSLQRMHQLRTYFNSAINVGVDPVEVQEVVIQCSVHAGFPATVNALELLRDVLVLRGETVDMPEVPEVPLEELDRRGRELYGDLFGDLPDAANDSTAATLTRLELRFGFGEILSRPGLDRRSRVIVAVAASLALRDDAELTHWLAAARRVGLSNAECDEVLLQCAYYVGIAPALRALRHGVAQTTNEHAVPTAT